MLDVSDETHLGELKLSFIHRLARRLVHPLTVVTATSSLLAEQAKEVRDAGLAELVEDSVRSSELCAHLVHQFLGFTARSCASSDAGGWTSYSLEDLVKEAAETSRELIREKGFQIVPVCQPESVQIEGDGAKLQLVFRELIENAVKYGHPGGRLLIGAEQEADRVKVAFLDDGPGITLSEGGESRTILREVDPYTAEEVPGLGVGLWLVGEAVHYLGGKMKLSSPANENQTGTLVQVLLPGSVGPTQPSDQEHTTRLAAFTF